MPAAMAVGFKTHADQPFLQTIFFDLDGTLYPVENGYEAHVRQRVFSFMHEKLGVPMDQTEDIWRRGFVKYNQSLKALQESGFEFNLDEYWQYIRAGAEKFLKPDPLVKQLIESLPQEKWVFTNADEKSAQHCLELLGLQGCFKGVIGANAMGDVCKPEAAAFLKALQISGSQPQRTAMFEDSFKNLKSAKALGLVTVLITGETAVEEAVSSADIAGVVDAVISSPTEASVGKVMPQLWHRSSVEIIR